MISLLLFLYRISGIFADRFPKLITHNAGSFELYAIFFIELLISIHVYDVRKLI